MVGLRVFRKRPVRGAVPWRFEKSVEEDRPVWLSIGPSHSL